MIPTALTFIHTCTIVRHDQTVTSQKKDTTETTVGTSIPCRIQPAGDVQQVSMLGAGTLDSFVGYFPLGTDVKHGDEVQWTEGNHNLRVTGLQTLQGLDAYNGTHIEVTLERIDT